MNALALPAVILLLASCATASRNPTPLATSDYTANRQSDGSVELVVTGVTAAPTPSTDASLELGTMLKQAAAKECPAGYELSQDPAPLVRSDSGKLVATLRGFARCK
jgi:hypothetical protein